MLFGSTNYEDQRLLARQRSYCTVADHEARNGTQTRGLTTRSQMVGLELTNQHYLAIDTNNTDILEQLDVNTVTNYNTPNNTIHRNKKCSISRTPNYSTT